MLHSTSYLRIDRSSISKQLVEYTLHSLWLYNKVMLPLFWSLALVITPFLYLLLSNVRKCLLYNSSKKVCHLWNMSLVHKDHLPVISCLHFCKSNVYKMLFMLLTVNRMVRSGQVIGCRVGFKYIQKYLSNLKYFKNLCKYKYKYSFPF